MKTLKIQLAFSSFLFALFFCFFIAISSAQDFDFFYFVQQWPGSYCDTKKSCCYPTTGKPEADFGIHGLWPNYRSGAYPSNCDPDSPYQPSTINDLISSLQKEWPTLACPSSDGNQFWEHEWEKHGTCSESVLDQHSYFEATLVLKKKINLLQILNEAGIKPDGGYYSLRSIRDAIKQATGITPWLECNVDEARNRQLYQVYMCVDTSATNLIECPVFPRGKCSDRIEFPPFINDLISSLQKEWPTLACPSSDGNQFWEHEWEKHGTCSESVLDQHAYFEATLVLKKKINLLQILNEAGIKPDGGYYSLRSIRDAIKQATGITPWLECNVDEARNRQLYQVYMCVDTSATNLIECPVFPRGKCSDRIEFPPF